MTLRDLIKSGMTWLNPDALVVTSVTTMRGYDFPFTIPRYIAAVDLAFSVEYVLLAFTFAAASLAAFRRPLLLIVVPAIIFFHL